MTPHATSKLTPKQCWIPFVQTYMMLCIIESFVLRFRIEFNPSDVITGFKLTELETSINSWIYERAICDSSGNVIITAAVNVGTWSISIPVPIIKPLIYTFYYGDSYLRQIKIDKDGKELWSNILSSNNNVEQPHQVAANVWLDKNDEIYLFRVDGSLMKYDGSSNIKWTFEPDSAISDWYVDNELYLYGISAGSESKSYAIIKYKQNLNYGVFYSRGSTSAPRH